MTRLLTQTGLVILFASTLGAAPGHQASDPAAKVIQRIPPPVFSQPVTKKSQKPPYQVGKASWYGSMFHGKETASGELFDMYDFTAAHPTLPLGSWVKVTNTRNRHWVLVRVNDRGPVVPGRIIDLSYEAAKQIGLSARGVATVRLDVIPENSQLVAEAKNRKSIEEER